MTLNECCALAQDMTRIPITVLQTSTDCMLFCTQYQFHPLQEYLLPHTMKLFLKGLSENETVCVTDPFHIPYDKITDQNAAGRSGQGLCRFAVQISL